jgi:hypothetical protein
LGFLLLDNNSKNVIACAIIYGGNKEPIETSLLKEEIIRFIKGSMDRNFDKLDKMENMNWTMVNIIKYACEMLLNESECFDVALQCNNGELVKCHKIFLKYLNCFGYFQDFIYKNDVETINVNMSANGIKCILQYLYCGTINTYISDNSMELLISVNNIGIMKQGNNVLTNDNFVSQLCRDHIISNLQKTINGLFQKYDFINFCDMIRQVVDIFELQKDSNSEIFLGCVSKWLNNNREKYDAHIVRKSYLFNKLIGTSIGHKIIIDWLDFDMFPLIVNSENQHELTELVICNADLDKMHSVIEAMYKVTKKCDYRTMAKLPISFFDTDIYKKGNIEFKINFIIIHKKYELLNEITDLDYKQNLKIIRNLDIINSCESLFVKTFIKSINEIARYVGHISKKINDHQEKNIIILNYFPLKFYYCAYIGFIDDIINDNTLCMYIKHNTFFVPIKKGTKLLVGQNVLEVDKMFNDGMEEQIIGAFVNVNNKYTVTFVNSPVANVIKYCSVCVILF